VGISILKRQGQGATSYSVLAVLSGLLITVIATYLFSLAVLLLLRIVPVNWEELSDVGQSFGGISAGLAAVALIALAWSVRLQIRQMKINSMQSTRQMQFDLVMMMLADPEYARLFLPENAPAADFEKFRVNVYATLHFRYQQYSFAAGELTDAQLRLMLSREYFFFPAFRSRWREIQPYWENVWRHGREGRFVRIATEECAKAEAEIGTQDEQRGPGDVSTAPNLPEDRSIQDR
jgi:Family of unknown function (DUF6082)